MRHYEIMLLIHPDRSDQVSSMVQRYTQMIESAKGVVHRLEDLKRRFLAYPINKLNKAYYVLLNVECDAKTQQEMQESIAFNDSIIRCLSIRQKQAITTPSVLNAKDMQDANASESENAGEDNKKPTAKTKKRKQSFDLSDKNSEIDYKNVELLMHCITDTKKIARARAIGANAKQQRQVSEAIKRARLVGLLSYCDKYEQPEIN